MPIRSASTRELGPYTNFVNLLGWCALALPAGFTSHGLPFGVTFIAPAGSDAALARFGALAGEPGAAARRDRRSAATARAHERPPRRRPAAEPTLPIAVVGAHLSGLPLNGQLTERGATLREATQTAPRYRLYALPGTTPPKPGLLRVADGGAAIAVEVWDMPTARSARSSRSIPPPLGLGSIELADGRQRARLPLRGARARRRRRHHRVRRLARLPRQPARRRSAPRPHPARPAHEPKPLRSTAVRVAEGRSPARAVAAPGRRRRRRRGRGARRAARSHAPRPAEDPHRLLAGGGRPAVLRGGREGLLQGGRASRSSRSSSPARSR